MPKSSPQEQVHSRGICPIDFKSARAFIQQNHSYLAAPRGCLFSVAAFEAADIVAVAIVGRPISRSQADGVTAEISRLCTHNAKPNTATALLKRVVQACRAIGYHRVITYVDATRDGGSFKAANFIVTAERERIGWHGRAICIPANASPHSKLFEWRAASYEAAVTAAKLRTSPIDKSYNSDKPDLTSSELPLWYEVANLLPLRD